MPIVVIEHSRIHGRRAISLALQNLLWLLLVGLITWPVTAAPVSGSFQVDLVFHPFSCGVDEDGDTFIDEDPPNGIDDDEDTLLDEDGCTKVDDTVLKLEADLQVVLNISGLQISTTTVFTLKGLEFQAFTVLLSIGALSIKDTFVFAPSIVEIEEVRTVEALALRYCVNVAAPGTITPPFFTCPDPDDMLYWLLEDGQRYHPSVANLRLARIFDDGGMLDPILVFRKKLADVSLSIAGMTLALRALFANVGDPLVPSFRVGTVLALEGQTVSGVAVRAETWLGARQGLECFGECKPLERLYGGMVIDTFSVQEEKLFVRNLTLAGVTFNVRAEFKFFAFPDTYCPVQGICYLEIQARGRLLPFLTNIENTVRIDHTLNPRADILRASLRFGDVSVTVVWYFSQDPTLDCGFGLPCPFESQLAELISTFDPPGVTITSDLVLCTERLFLASCADSNGVLQHDVVVQAEAGNLTLEARVILLGIFTDFYQFWVDAAWQVGEVTFTASVVISVESLDALAFGTRLRF